MYNSSNIAENIKIIAKRKNIMLKDLFAGCDIHKNTLSQMYHGQSIAFDSLAKIADYLDVSVDYLLDRTGSQPIIQAEIDITQTIRTLDSKIITQKIKEAFIEANLNVSKNLVNCIKDSAKSETSPLARNILNKLTENIEIAKEINVPICQDTGMAVLFVNIGQDVHIIGGLLRDAINQGVREAYVDGDLRLSVVKDPIRRGNTNDNTPAIIHTDIVAGDKIEIICVPKGFGSENSSRLKMFEPSASEDDIIDFIVETIKIAGGNPCPPIVVGVGIGGDFEYSAILAKKALTREIGENNPDEFYGRIEQKTLERINQTNVGPQGFGGKTTAFAVNIETFPTHIAGLPVAVNICCHVYRHKKVVI